LGRLRLPPARGDVFGGDGDGLDARLRHPVDAGLVHMTKNTLTADYFNVRFPRLGVRAIHDHRMIADGPMIAAEND
jgi:hypothetical protein